MKILTYLFKGQIGFIARIDNEKLKGVKPIEECYDMGFYPIEVAEKYNITYKDCLAEYEDSYNFIENYKFNNDEKEIVNEEVVNVENEQRLIYCFVNKKYYEADLYKRMMLTETHKYYSWQSALTKTLKHAHCEIATIKRIIEDRILYIDCDGEEYNKKEKEIIEEEYNNAKEDINKFWEKETNEYKQYYTSYADKYAYIDEGKMTFDKVWEIIEDKIIDDYNYDKIKQHV